ncbi:MAG TPA: GNAT family N-acetyltransferase [Polyangiaceae bacterium]|nr:GNAT family N-acetyltransferase [Polyangiaceae bacterium]
MDAGIEIRLLAESDSLTELTELLHRAYAPLAAQGLRYLATHQDAETTKRRVTKGECYLAFLDARLAGTILVIAPGAMRHGAYYARPGVAGLSQFGVEPELQRRGIGARLMDLGERRARELGASEVAVDTAEPARHLIELYERRGYRKVGTEQWQHTNFRSVILSKLLGS